MYSNQNDSTAGRKRRIRRKEQVLYYNSPFSSTVKTKIRKQFLKIVDKQFPKKAHSKKFSTETQSK